MSTTSVRLIFLLSILISACSETPKQPNTESKYEKPDTSKAITETESVGKREPIYGYRYKVHGDFDADGVTDTLTEVFYSLLYGREVNKYYSDADPHENADSAYARQCISFAKCSNPALDTFPDGRTLGFIWLKCEGDLDGDPGDEVSVINSLPQMSSMNNCHIYSFKNNKWQYLYSFEVREWMVPPRPGGGLIYSYFGSVVSEKFDSDSVAINFNAFPGFIKNLGNGMIKIKVFTVSNGEHEAIVDIKPCIKKPDIYWESPN